MNGKISPERYQSYYKRGVGDHAHYNATRAKLHLGLPAEHRTYAADLGDGQEFLAWLDGWSAHQETLAEPGIKKAETGFLGAVRKWASR